MQRAITASQQLSRQILWRLAVPTIGFMFLSSLDRVNISFAALQMNKELGFSPSQYGFGAGILFLGFLLGQYPSVLLLQRIGMRRWMAACCIVWGLSGAAIAAASTPQEFYILRVVLGFAEGGLAPGIVLYLSQFTTERDRATTFALPMLAIPLSLVLGSPLSGWLLTTVAPFGLSNWRWMLIAEALPTIVLGLVSLWYFPNSPREAAWLSSEDKIWLESNAANRAATRVANDWSVLAKPLVWCSALLWFCLLSGAYGIMFWLPQIVKQLSSLTPLQIGFVNALPWAGALIGTYANSRHSDRTGERFLHVGVPAIIAAVSLLLAYFLSSAALGIAILFLAGLSLGAAQGAFWAVPTRALSPATFAVAAVAINIAGTSGGVVMPQLIGFIRGRSGTFLGPTLLLAGTLACAALLVLLIKVLFFRERQVA
jgi:ACS family tartrate transporter-like MFS transporter